jgi:hypothetical protein
MNARTPPPRHFWPVAAVSLLWNAFGAYDFVMTNARAPAYVASLPAEAMQYLDVMPIWALGAWLLGVGGAVLGSVLLLACSRFAVHSFALSLAGLAGNTAYRLIGETPETMRTGATVGLTLAVWIVAIFLLCYAAAMRRRGVLR